MAAMARSGALLLLASLRAAVGTPIGGTVGEMVPTELPGPGFPGPTASASQMAWPVTHRQPGRYDAWPQLGYGTANRTLLPCWKRTALRDHANGWPGMCMKLMQATKYATEEGCKSLCWNEPRCAVWQYVNQTTPNQCWVGWGENCAYREGPQGALSVQAAQRIWHGSVRVLKNLSGWKINNLYNLGMYHTGDEHVSIMRCRSWCYTDIACQYWQYGPGGCWVDAPRFSASQGNNINNRVQYPLTTDGGASKTSSDALTMMYGEYIQHYCPPQFSTTAPMLESPVPQLPLLTTGAPSASPSIAWWVWCLGGLAILLCAGVGAYVVMGQQGEGQKRSTRSKRSGRIAMSDYSNEDQDSPLVTPPKSRYSPASDYQAPPPAPTDDYLNTSQPQDYQQWPQQSQPPPPGRYGGGMPETQNLAGQRPTNLMHAPPETMTQQGMAPPTQPYDMMQNSQAMYGYPGRQQYPQGGRPMGGMPFPMAGGQRPSMQGMQAPTARLM